MSSTKYLLPIAAAGGAVYWYDQNVEPIFSKRKVPEVPATTGERINRDINNQVNKFEKKSKQLQDKVSNFANDKEKEISRRTESTLDSIKNSSLVSSISGNAQETKRRAEALRDDKNVFYRVADSYIDFVNELGYKVNPSGSSLTTEFRDRKRQAEDDAKSYFGWLGSKRDEAAKDFDRKYAKGRKEAEATKNEWFSWGSKKKEEAEDAAKDNLESLKKWNEKEAEKVKETKNSWMSWGAEKKDEAAARANEEANKLEKQKDKFVAWGAEKKDEALKGAEREAERLEETKSRWASWDADMRDKAVNDANRRKEELENTKDRWVSWGSEKKHEAEEKARREADKLEKSKDSWLSWGSSKKQEAEERTRSDLEETRKTLTSKYNEGKNKAAEAIDDASKSIKSTYDEGVQKALDNYNAARDELERLSVSANENVKSLFNKQDPDPKDKLKKAQKDFNSALSNLRSYGGDLVDEADQKYNEFKAKLTKK